MSFVVVVLVLFGAAFVVQLALTTAAHQQIDVDVRGRRHEILQSTQSYFGRTWTRVSGSGDVNVRPAMRHAPPTLSVSVVETGHDTCRVAIWVSSSTTFLLVLMNHAGLARRKKRGLVARLQAEPASRGTERPSAATD